MRSGGKEQPGRRAPGRPWRSGRSAAWAWVLAAAALAACGRGEEAGRHQALVLDEQDRSAAEPLAGEGVEIAGEVVYEDLDRRIFEEKMRWALEQRLDTLPIGEIVARLGRTFVGTKYTPGTLEIEGPERLVLNLRELDCVTFVENVLALARLVRAGGGSFEDFQRELRGLRYRGGVIDGYPSRLHYFSEWIRDNAEMRLVRDVTRELGGVQDREPIAFMSANRELYPKLAGDEQNVRAIRAIEERLSEEPRYFIPESRIAAVAPRIRSGDVIAATSTVEGLDVAHTGFALWVDGRLHLMHAPLVGKSVEISELPLAERIAGIEGQDGIMVARPL